MKRIVGISMAEVINGAMMKRASKKCVIRLSRCLGLGDSCHLRLIDG